jgi:hypothetical protein
VHSGSATVKNIKRKVRDSEIIVFLLVLYPTKSPEILHVCFEGDLWRKKKSVEENCIYRNIPLIILTITTITK